MYENYSILFVDDEIHILNSLRRGLLEEKFTCHFAESAMKAIDVLETETIHVIVTDMRMPEMNGLELLKHVQVYHPTIIKLVLSGYAQLPQILTTINQVDIFNFILKPWSIEELAVILHRALDHYILQEENASYKALLETKNQAYQSILKRIDDVVDQAKKSAELLRICGNEIIGFGKNFCQDEQSMYHEILTKQQDMYNLLSKTVTIERKACESDHIQQQITQLISKQFPEAVFDTRPEVEDSVFVNLQMLEAIISSIIVLFHEEFTQHGLYVNFGYGNRFIISLISPNAAKAAAEEASDTTTCTDAKRVWIKNLLEKIFDLCKITFQIINKDGNLVIGFSFEEQ